MNFIIRNAEERDIEGIFYLARQFNLLSLPADKKIIEKKVQASIASFAGEKPKEEGSFMLVIEDRETHTIAGTSQIKAKKGTPKEPAYSFKLLKRERFSRALGVGFIHQILRLKINEDGPTEIGGLVVDKSYRSRPEKVGKLISLARFNLVAQKPELFSEQIMAEMAPPLTDEGRSEFWEALGRRFTGMPYQEADLLSQKNKEFIKSLFPEEDIYMCLLDSKARLVVGRVGIETQPALHLLESIGMRYLEEIDPFDGGPHYGAHRDEISLIRNTKSYSVDTDNSVEFSGQAVVSVESKDGYKAVGTAYKIVGDSVKLPELALITLGVKKGENVLVTPLEKF